MATTLRGAEDVLQQAILGEAIDSGPVAVFVADAEMRYVAVNQAACDLLGYERSELLELTVSDVSPAEKSSTLYREMVDKGALVGRVMLVRKDRREIDAVFTAFETTVGGEQMYASYVRRVA